MGMDGGAKSPVVTVERFSTESGIPVSALKRLIASGRLRSVRLPGVRQQLVLRADVERLVVMALDAQ